MFKVGEVIGVCGNISSNGRQQSWNDNWKNQLLDKTDASTLQHFGGGFDSNFQA